MVITGFFHKLPVLISIFHACGHKFPCEKNDRRPFAKRSLLRNYWTSSLFLARFLEMSSKGISSWQGAFSQSFSLEVGVTVIFRSIKLNLRSCFRQFTEPAPGPLVLRPDPELTQHVLRKGEYPEGLYFIREFLFNNTVVTDCVPDFFQRHNDHRRGTVYQSIGR